MKTGDIKQGRMWASCLGCGKERWVSLLHGEVRNKYCGKCACNLPEVKEHRRLLSTGRVHTQATKDKIRAQQTGRFGSENSAWKGGKYTENGYVFVKLLPNDFFYSMSKHDGYLYEHRLVMAKSLGRSLQRWEVVHHKNHIRSDNRIENLQLVSDDRHRQITILENRITNLEHKVDEQSKFIKLLQWQLKDEVSNNIGLREDSTSMV